MILNTGEAKQRRAIILLTNFYLCCWKEGATGLKWLLSDATKPFLDFVSRPSDFPRTFLFDIGLKPRACGLFFNYQLSRNNGRAGKKIFKTSTLWN